MKSGSGWLKAGLVLAVGTICIVFAGSSFGHVHTQKTTTAGQVTTEVQVERGEVAVVNGDDLVVKMEDGSIRHIPNVPESARVTVDGRQLGIHDLVATAAPTPAPTAAATALASTPAPAKLPKTASELPLVGLLGLLCISASLGARFLRAKLGV
jgi:hypothetical protein